MKSSPRALTRTLWLGFLLSACATTAAAQTTAVTRDRSTIWQPDFRAAAAIVEPGTVLTIVGQRDDWYEVELPESYRASGLTRGFVFKSSIDAAGRVPAAALQGQTAAGPRPRTFGVLGFGHFGYTRFAAQRSFGAVLGQGGGASFGGGAEVRIGGRWFLNASVERFRKRGERVFVFDEQVFKLGIPNTVTLMPVSVTTGWRFRDRDPVVYAGGGLGRVLYEESSRFSDDSDKVNERFASYHALGGVEFRNEWVATAFEVQYSRVPGAIGVGGASAVFKESDLGGLVARVKVLVGR
jgi:hypothetical protein